MTSRTSPDRPLQTSPIKVKDYFTNPLHRIKQSSFTEVSFTVSALNTFVRNFSHKANPKFISLHEIQQYVKKFSTDVWTQQTTTLNWYKLISISLSRILRSKMDSSILNTLLSSLSRKLSKITSLRKQSKKYINLWSLWLSAVFWTKLNIWELNWLKLKPRK